MAGRAQALLERVSLPVLLAAALIAWSAPPASPQQPESSPVEKGSVRATVPEDSREVLVEFRQGVGRALRSAIHSRAGGRAIGRLPSLAVDVVRLPDAGGAREAIASYRRRPSPRAPTTSPYDRLRRSPRRPATGDGVVTGAWTHVAWVVYGAETPEIVQLRPKETA